MKKLIALVVVLVLLLVVALQPNVEKQQEYTIVYYAGKNTQSIPAMTVKKNGKAFRPIDPFRTDAIFNGWYLSLNPAEEEERFDFENTNITKSITLFANWTFDSYTIEYDLNGGYWPNEPYASSFSTSDSQVFLKPISSATHPKHDSYGRFADWRAISQAEYLKLTPEEQKNYPVITSFTPKDEKTLTAFDENKHIILYAYYRNYKGEEA